MPKSTQIYTSYKEKRRFFIQVILACIKNVKKRTIACIKMLCLQLNSSEAGGYLLAGDFMIRNAGTAMSVTGTIFCARAIYGVMWAGHSGLLKKV